MFCGALKATLNYFYLLEASEFDVLNIKYMMFDTKHPPSNIMVVMWWSSGVEPLIRIGGKIDKFKYVDILNVHILRYDKQNMAVQSYFQQDDPKHKSCR